MSTTTMPTRRSALAALALSASMAFALARPVAAHDEFRFVGVLTTVDLSKNAVTVKYKEFDGKEDTVVVKLNAAKGQLAAGLNVVIDALGCDDDFDAVAIRIVPAAKK
jgi:hypothetical protein